MGGQNERVSGKVYVNRDVRGSNPLYIIFCSIVQGELQR